ncbi:MAG: rhodanese-like domain-containing protein [Gemmatimonadetes bacterium]|nr:rhodanese-like domain-containing protein [Gemmatimonadota bacterium]
MIGPMGPVGGATAPAALALAFLLGCRGGEVEADREGGSADTRAVVADTQLVVDSSGAILEIVTRRSRPGIREVKPRAGAGDPDAPDVLRALEPTTVHSLLQGATPRWYVLDVRDARAFATEGHLPGALLVPLAELEGNVDDLHVRTDQVLLVYGGEGNEGWRAGRLLASYGFPVVRVLEGGFPAWRAADLPVEGAR